jgi:hypothetical protein
MMTDEGANQPKAKRASIVRTLVAFGGQDGDGVKDAYSPIRKKTEIKWN